MSDWPGPPHHGKLPEIWLSPALVAILGQFGGDIAPATAVDILATGRTAARRRNGLCIERRPFLARSEVEVFGSPRTCECGGGSLVAREAPLESVEQVWKLLQQIDGEPPFPAQSQADVLGCLLHLGNRLVFAEHGANGP